MIIDCFIFNNEFNLLTSRLNYLQHAVDKFLVVESLYTFTGIKKSFKLKSYISKNLASIAHKIIVLENDKYLSSKELDEEIRKLLPYKASLDELQQNLTSIKVDWVVWLNDGFQRELLIRLIDEHCDDSSIIIISDVDEIPSLDFICNLQSIGETLTFAEMDQYRYDVHFRDATPWIGSVATRRSTVLTEGVNRLRFFTKRNLTHINFQIKISSGWHLTSFGSPDEIHDKLSSWGHQELNTPINRLMLKFRIKRGLDIFGRPMEINYTKNPNIPNQILGTLTSSYLHSYRYPTCFDKAINSVACFIDKVYRGVRSQLHQIDIFKR